MVETVTDSKGYVTLQLTLLLIAIAVLLFATILLGVSSSLAELNIALPVLAIAIVLISAAMAFKKLPTTKWTTIILLSLIITFLLFISILILQQDLAVQAVTSFTISSTLFMILGISTAIGLMFSKLGTANFITWQKTNIWREFFFVGVALWFVFGMTFYLSVANNTPFETTAFLGVPFSAAQIDWQSDLFEAGVKGVAGFVEGNFFFTFLLGLLSVVGITRFIPENADWYVRLIVVAIIAGIFAFIVMWLHTGMHDVTQADVLFYIGLFFFAGATTTLFFQTSFSFIVAHGFLDFMKALFASGNPAMSYLAYITLFSISLIAIFSFFMWRNDGNVKKFLK